MGLVVLSTTDQSLCCEPLRPISLDHGFRRDDSELERDTRPRRRASARNNYDYSIRGTGLRRMRL